MTKTTDLRTRELMFKMRKDSIREHLDMLIKRSERQTEELKLMRKRMNEEECNLVSTLEVATEYIENTDWHLTRGISLTNELLIAKMYLQEERDREDLKNANKNQ